MGQLRFTDIIWFSFAVAVSDVNCYEPSYPGRCRSFRKHHISMSSKFENAKNTQEYFPTSGIETFITTVASRRMLLPTEYELSFESYPVLKDRFHSKKWPERTLEDFEDIEKFVLVSLHVNEPLDPYMRPVTATADCNQMPFLHIRSILWISSTRNNQDVERVLLNFRKTVLGLEK